MSAIHASAIAVKMERAANNLLSLAKSLKEVANLPNGSSETNMRRHGHNLSARGMLTNHVFNDVCEVEQWYSERIASVVNAGTVQTQPTPTPVPAPVPAPVVAIAAQTVTTEQPAAPVIVPTFTDAGFTKVPEPSQQSLPPQFNSAGFIHVPANNPAPVPAANTGKGGTKAAQALAARHNLRRELKNRGIVTLRSVKMPELVQLAIKHGIDVNRLPQQAAPIQSAPAQPATVTLNKDGTPRKRRGRKPGQVNNASVPVQTVAAQTVPTVPAQASVPVVPTIPANANNAQLSAMTALFGMMAQAMAVIARN